MSQRLDKSSPAHLTKKKAPGFPPRAFRQSKKENLHVNGSFVDSKSRLFNCFGFCWMRVTG
jgi:hypothetical protein